MRLEWVELRDFRNHSYTRLEPPAEGLIVAVGANGEGKTNLLEAIFFLFGAGSPRSSSNSEMVRIGAAAGYVRGQFDGNSGRALTEIEVPSEGSARMKVNGNPVRRRNDLRKQVRMVFFVPEDLKIVTGDPSNRRSLMDEALTALWPTKAGLITAYDRVLRQRNRLLKEWDKAQSGRGYLSGMTPPGLELWDQQLAQAGSALIQARAEAIEKLAPGASEAFREIAGYDLGVTYMPDVAAPGDIAEAFVARLAERREDEIIRRVTLVGPHRDDVKLEVRDMGARSFASHGESWAAALCVRLGLASAVGQEIGEPPILLVDDPCSALDPDRTRQLGKKLAERGGQVFMSVADRADIPAEAAAVWAVKAGTVDAQADKAPRSA